MSGSDERRRVTGGLQAEGVRCPPAVVFGMRAGPVHPGSGAQCVRHRCTVS